MPPTLIKGNILAYGVRQINPMLFGRDFNFLRTQSIVNCP